MNSRTGVGRARGNKAVVRESRDRRRARMALRSSKPVAVYPPREDTELLLPCADVAPGTTLVEVGCGRGAAALRAARGGARVVATDLNPDAVAHVARSARAEDLALVAVRTDLAHGVRSVDRVLFNPPS